MDSRAVEELHDLERRDEELAASTAHLHSLQAEVARVRERADAIDAFFAAMPENEERLQGEIADAEREMAARREAQSLVESELELARSDEQREAREKALARARDHVAVAVSRLDRLRAELEHLEGDAAELPGELAQLETEARSLAASAPELPAVHGDGLAAWASHAHAELFVALSQLDSRRERIIREANELASSVLGEPTFGSTVAQARRQAEARA